MLTAQVKIRGTYQLATMTLATASELKGLGAWLKEYGKDKTQETIDILEYTEGALAKRDKYLAYGRCPASWHEFIGRAKARSTEEVAGVFVLKCSTLADKLLGFIFVRRNWDHSLVMDYLAGRPKSDDKIPEVKGIGLALFLAVCKLADECEADYLWWEATPESAGFYANLLGRVGAYESGNRPKSILAISRDLYLRAIEALTQST